MGHPLCFSSLNQENIEEMILEPLSHVYQVVLARLTRQESRTARRHRPLGFVCPWRDPQGERPDPVPHLPLVSCMGTCQLVHLVGLLHEQCEILTASTRTTGHGASSCRTPMLSATSWEAGKERLEKAWLCTDLLTNSPQVSLVVFSKMLWVMWAGGRDSAQTPFTASRGCVQHQALTLMDRFKAACSSGTGIIPGPRGLG